MIPPAHAEQAHALEAFATGCSLDTEGGPGMGGPGAGGPSTGGPATGGKVSLPMPRIRRPEDEE